MKRKTNAMHASFLFPVWFKYDFGELHVYCTSIWKAREMERMRSPKNVGCRQSQYRPLISKLFVYGILLLDKKSNECSSYEVWIDFNLLKYMHNTERTDIPYTNIYLHVNSIPVTLCGFNLNKVD